MSMGQFAPCSPIIESTRLERVRVGLATLTPREREVLRFLVSGVPAKDAASTLGISVRTVENYAGRAREKLGLHDMVRVAVYVSVIEGVAMG